MLSLSGARLAGGRSRPPALTAARARDGPPLAVSGPRTRDLRPSTVATRRRDVTRRMALRIFEEGGAGFGWWSTLEASWANMTLFSERAAPHLRVEGEPEFLSIDHPAVWVAADALGIRLG